MLLLKDIWEAKCQIKRFIHRTMIIKPNSLKQRTGKEIFLKCENLQKTGSFKVRGAFNSILSLPLDKRNKGVIAFSSGNHAQAVAYAARLLNLPATIVMPTWVNPSKLAATKAYGANVVLHGATSVDIFNKSKEIMEKEDLYLIHPFDTLDTISGQGTMALEFLEDVPDVDTVFVPVGGGGLISGIALALKSISPKIKAIGVQPLESCSMIKSIEKKRIVEIDSCNTIADGLVAKKPGENTFCFVNKYVDDLVTVTDKEIEETMMYILQRTKMFIEPTGAVALAAIINRKAKLGIRNIAILSGGNCNTFTLENILKKFNSQY